MSYLDELNAQIAEKETALEFATFNARRLGRKNRYGVAHRERAKQLAEDLRALRAQRDLELVDAEAVAS